VGVGDNAARDRWQVAPERIGEDTRGLHGQSAAMQTTPKFGPRLRCREPAAENMSGRWAKKILAPVKIGPI
jgi:hypothetical protein